MKGEKATHTHTTSITQSRGRRSLHW